MKLRRIRRWFKRRWTKMRGWRVAALASIVAGFFHLYLLYPIPGVPASGFAGIFLEPKIMDFWFALRGRRTPPPEVLVLGVDEKSYDELNASRLEAFPRELVADFLHKVAPHEPKFILLDYLYSEERDPEIDARLAEGMRINPTFIGRATKYVERVNAQGKLVTEEVPLDPVSPFRDAAKGIFFVNIPIESGVSRRFKTGPGTTDNIPPVAAAIFGKDAKAHPLPGPFDFINYYGPPGSVRTISFYEVFNKSPQELDQLVRGKYLFVGQQIFLTFRKEQTDAFLTPFHRQTAGVEIHATTAANILEQSWVKRFSVQDEGLIAIIVAALCTYTIMTVTPWIGLWTVIGLGAAWIAASYIAFLNQVFIPGAVFMFVALPFIYAVTSIKFYLRSRELERAIGLTK